MDLPAFVAPYVALLASLDPAGSPAMLALHGDVPPGARLALMSGSFNPPTRAHLGLAEAALSAGEFDRLLFALAVRTINKERIVGALLEERCVMLAALVAAEPRFALVGANRGLYLDQARAAHAAFAPHDLAFIVGFDKIVQIVDPQYYDDRDAALDELFRLARFLVAPRDGATSDELDALFARPENRPYAGRARFLPLSRLDADAQQLSSTRVRELLARGEDVSWAIPKAVWSLLKGMKAYQR